MKIDILANDGSPLGVTEMTIFGHDGRLGCGGAELGILTLCKGWHDKGYEVTFYNDPAVENGSCFKQCPISTFDPQADRDILIVFRSPNDKSLGAKGKKIWYSNDQFTVGSFHEFAKTVQKIVVISPFHARYFQTQYGIENTIVIDIPVRSWEYDEEIEKAPRRCIFTSMPDRGLMELSPLWKRIMAEVPDASLTITSDWRLWDIAVGTQPTNPYRAAFAGVPNVTYLGAINRRQLIREQLAAELHIYPSVYNELFCIAIAESQVAGAFPVTSGWGCLSTTNMGKIIEGTPGDARFSEDFVNYVVWLLRDDVIRKEMQEQVRQKAVERFSLDKILDKWEEVFNA